MHVILDREPYNKSAETRESARKNYIGLRFLMNSPNLNPIEQLLKVMRTRKK
ncbi:MAG: hypothetical protein LBS28_03360 [Streptococcaceae bacterium]|nr:hypothetical protein [Streptococcaceae bacterium]